MRRKNTIQEGTVHFLILKVGDKHIGICKEFGFVEEGNSLQGVRKRLENSALLLLETVAKNPSLEPSLNVNPPFKYLCIYYVAPILTALTLPFRRFNGNIHLITQDVSGLAHTHA